MTRNKLASAKARVPNRKPRPPGASSWTQYRINTILDQMWIDIQAAKEAAQEVPQCDE